MWSCVKVKSRDSLLGLYSRMFSASIGEQSFCSVDCFPWTKASVWSIEERCPKSHWHQILLHYSFIGGSNLDLLKQTRRVPRCWKSGMSVLDFFPGVIYQSNFDYLIFTGQRFAKSSVYWGHNLIIRKPQWKSSCYLCSTGETIDRLIGRAIFKDDAEKHWHIAWKLWPNVGLRSFCLCDHITWPVGCQCAPMVP